MGIRDRQERRVPPAPATAFLAAALLLVSLPAPSLGQVVALVEIQVVSGATGDPVPRARATVEGTGQSGIAGSGGRVTLRGLPPGPHRVRVEALGYRTTTAVVRAVNGRTVRIQVPLPPDPLELPGLRVGATAGRSPLGGSEVIVAGLSPAVRDLPEALEEVPGVTVVRRGGPGAPATLQLRGAESHQILVLLDGVALNSPLTGEVDLATVDLEALERIVVLPGARSSRYGPRAMGGVVLLESRASRATRATSGHFTAGAGAWGEREVSGTASWDPIPAWSLSTGGRWSRADGDFTHMVPDFRGGGEARRENAEYRRAGGHLRLARTGEGITGALRLHLTDIRRGSPGAVAQPSLTGKQRHRRHGVSLRAQAGDDGTGGSLLMAFQEHRGEYRDSAPPFGQAYHQVARVTQQEAGLEGWRTMGPLILQAGGDLRDLQVRSDALQPPSVDLRQGGAWARAELALNPSPQTAFQLRGGLRADGHELVEGATLSPGVEVNLRRGRTTLGVAYRSGFSPPGLADLFFQEGVLVRPNPELRPERAEGDVSLTLGQGVTSGPVDLQLQLALYQGDIHDMILWFPDFRFVWSPRNFDVARGGLDLDASAELTLFGHTHSLSAHASWSRVSYEGGVLDGQVAYRPELTAGAHARIELGFGEASARLSHVGRRRSVAGSDLNALSPYHLVDVGLALPFEVKGWLARAEGTLSNLLDERAALLVDYPLPGRGWSVRVRLSPTSRP